jgi:rod shape-determining protein MreD
MAMMTGFLGGSGRHETSRRRLRALLLILAPVLAIAVQVKAPLFSEYFSFLEPPLLLTVYLALKQRDAVRALLLGGAIGLAQDALSSNPLGLFGIVKTLTAYFAASASLRFDAESPLARFGFCFGFYVLHQVMYWTVAAALLGQHFNWSIAETLLFGVMNGAVAVPLFQLLDRL